MAWLVTDRNHVIVWRRIFVHLILTYVIMSCRNAHCRARPCSVSRNVCACHDVSLLSETHNCCYDIVSSLHHKHRVVDWSGPLMLIIHRKNMGRLRCSRMWDRGPWDKLVMGYGAVRCVPEDRLWNVRPCSLALWPKFFCLMTPNLSLGGPTLLTAFVKFDRFRKYAMRLANR